VSESIWQDVEFGDFAADFEIWRELAADHGDDDRIADVLDIGAGVGRVSLDLAARGHRVSALDSDSALLAELGRRAGRAGLTVQTVSADARDFELGREFDLVLAPMQLLQLLGGSDGRRGFYDSAARALRPGGLLAIALVDLGGEPTGEAYEPPLPDLRDVDDWVYASQPLRIGIGDDGAEIVLERMRTVVSPAGKVTEQPNTIALQVIGPERCEREARGAGLVPEERVAIAATDRYVGSVVVLLRRPI
jgi:SAM-dependent methyltransferase